MARSYHPLVLLVIGLAIFGFGHQLIFNTVQLLTQIALFGGIAALLFLLYKRFMNNNYGATHRPKQSIQPKQQTKSYKQPNRPSASNVISHRNAQKLKRTNHKPINKRTTSPNLTVIEGKKGKKKNRALF